MKILYDHQIFDMQTVGGISRYYYELITHFDQDESVECELSILYSNNEYLKSLPYYKHNLLARPAKVDDYKKFFWGKDFKGKGLFYKVRKTIVPQPDPNRESVINKSKSIEKIKEGNFDVFHPTYYDDYFLEYLNGKPFVITVYDLIHQIFPEFGLYGEIDKSKELLQRAGKILAISESTKADLINIFNIDEIKIEVTHLATSLMERPTTVAVAFIEELPQRYLLYVGERGAYKNFLFFSHVFAALTRHDNDLCIICTGLPFDEMELYLFKKLGLTARVLHRYVHDNELISLYTHALSLIFPSMYEGFGLPVLEAFSCGCPVLASKTSSLREIGGDAVIYFEPKDPASMINAIRSVLDDAALRNKKILQGYQQLKKFSWQKTVDATKRVYQQVASGNN